MFLHDPFGHLAAQVMEKEGSGVKLAI